jgi:uncharacterized protein (DUF362 family)
MDPGIYYTGKRKKEGTYSALLKFDYLPKKKKILIQPNIVGPYSPTSPYITSPRVVEGIIEYLRDKSIDDISIGEGPVRDAQEVFRKTGYLKLSKKTGVELIDFYDTERKGFTLKSQKISVPKIVLESEYINVAKLKTHVATGVTLCLKNQKGLLSTREKMISHKNLHASIAGLYHVIRPDFSMVDATDGVEENGPGYPGKRVKNIKLLVMGKDSLKVDFLSAMLMGIDPMEIKHLNIAAKGKSITLPQETLDSLYQYRMNFKRPLKYINKFNLYFWHTERTCSGCTCAFADSIMESIKNPIKWPRIIYRCGIKRTDVLSGDVNIPKEHGRIICIGECTRKLAHERGFPWVPGCPPKGSDILKRI